MRTKLLPAALLLAAFASSAVAQSSSPSTTKAPAKAPETIWEPSVKLGKDGQPDDNFLQRHQAFLDRAKEGPVGLLLLGDSITSGWGAAKSIYDDAFGAYKPANFGIGGDRTQHVLWRIANGELDQIDPKVVMLMIGTNNIGNPKEDIIHGVTAVVEAIHAKKPKAKILLLGIFPRGADPADAKVKGTRQKIAEINAALAKLDDGKTVKYLDIGQVFLDEKDVLTPEISKDALHFTKAGYEKWADAVKPVIADLMK